MTELLRGNSQRRMLKALAELMQGKELDRHTAAELLDVNHECAYRILDVLLEAVPGVVVVDGRPRRFAFDQTRSTGGASSSGNVMTDALAAALGAATAKAFAGTDYETELRNNRDRVVRAASRTHKNLFSNIGRKLFVIGGQEEMLDDKSELFRTAVDALLRQREVRARYQRFDGTIEELELKPYTLVVHDAHLYLVANGNESPFHTYRFSRILSLESLSSRFDYPAATEYNPEALFRDSLGVFLSPEPTKVHVRLHEKWAVYAKHHRWHSSQKVKERPDRFVDLTMHVRPCRELEQWVLRFGDEIEVIEPADLRERILQRLRSACALYGEPTTAR